MDDQAKDINLAYLPVTTLDLVRVFSAAAHLFAALL